MDFDFGRVVDLDNVVREVLRRDAGSPEPTDPVLDDPVSSAQTTTPASLSTPSSVLASSASASSGSSSPSVASFQRDPRRMLPPKTQPKLRSRPKAALAKTCQGSPPRSSPSLRARRGAANKASNRRPLEELGKKPTAREDVSVCLVLPPDMDMSSAIALSRNLTSDRKDRKRSYTSAFGWNDDHGYRPYEPAFSAEETISYYPRQYLSMEDACCIPDKPLRTELVRLYFMHFHPFCPVVNEIDFMDIYDNSSDDEQLKKRIDLTLFQAMMFVAFGHLPLSYLPKTPYKSIPEGQKVYFEKASVLYHMNYTLDHLSMAKVALLFTYWHPFDSESQVNNYWVDRAFSHARAIKLWDSKYDDEDTSSRRRIVWWCCLLRDRLVSFALRRAYRIHEAQSKWPIVGLTDFGLESMFPKFTDVKAKQAEIDAFIWQCKLSDIILDVAVFQEKNRFPRSWSGTGIEKDAIMPELNQVSQFDYRLNNWKEGYLKVNGDCIRSPRPSVSKMPNYVQIISDSTIASLYLPYIGYPSPCNRIAQEFQRVALGKIKASSSMVALQVRKLNSAGRVGEEIAVGIVGWIALPMATFKVLSDTNGVVPTLHSTTETGRYEDFVPFLESLARRFHAARVLSEVMTKATGEIVEKTIELGLTRIDKAQPRQPSDSASLKLPKGSDAGTGGTEGKEVDEVEILDCISKMVDLRLSTNE